VAASNPQAPRVQILFTGKLLGYFRVPDRQDGTAPASQQICPEESKREKQISKDTESFLKTIQRKRDL